MRKKPVFQDTVEKVEDRGQTRKDPQNAAGGSQTLMKKSKLAKM